MRPESEIVTKFYTPAPGFSCITQPIPFYLTLESSFVSLASCLPFNPTASISGPRNVMRVQLMRQTTVDARYGPSHFLFICSQLKYTRTTNLRTDFRDMAIKTDMWRIDQIGEGTFTLVVSGFDL